MKNRLNKLCVLMIVSLLIVGCNTTSNEIDNDYFTESKKDKKEKTEKTEKTDKEDKKDKSDKNDEKVSSKISDYEFIMENKVYSMPILLKDIALLGFEIDEERSMFTNIVSTIRFSKGDVVLTATVMNYDLESEEEVLELAVSALSIENRSGDSDDYAFIKGIKFGDSLESVKDAMGKPKMSTENTLVFEDTSIGDGYTFMFIDNKLVSVKMKLPVDRMI